MFYAVSFTHRPRFTSQNNFLVLISVTDWKDGVMKKETNRQESNPRPFAL
jgi:hypothetical protein